MFVYKGEKKRKKREVVGDVRNREMKRENGCRERREMKEEGREDTEVERTGDIPLGESHR